MKLPHRNLNPGACPQQTLILVEGFVNYQMTNTPLNLKKKPKYPLKHRKRAKTPRYLEKDQYTPKT